MSLVGGPVVNDRSGAVVTTEDLLNLILQGLSSTSREGLRAKQIAAIASYTAAIRKEERDNLRASPPAPTGRRAPQFQSED